MNASGIREELRINKSYYTKGLKVATKVTKDNDSL